MRDGDVAPASNYRENIITEVKSEEAVELTFESGMLQYHDRAGWLEKSCPITETLQPLSLHVVYVQDRPRPD